MIFSNLNFNKINFAITGVVAIFITINMLYNICNYQENLSDKAVQTIDSSFNNCDSSFNNCDSSFNNCDSPSNDIDIINISYEIFEDMSFNSCLFFNNKNKNKNKNKNLFNNYIF